MGEILSRISQNLTLRVRRAPVCCVVAGVIPVAAVVLAFVCGSPRHDDLIFSVAMLSMIAVLAWGLVFRDQYVAWRSTGWKFSIRTLFVATTLVAVVLGLLVWTAGWSAEARCLATLIAAALGLVAWAAR